MISGDDPESLFWIRPTFKSKEQIVRKVYNDLLKELHQVYDHPNYTSEENRTVTFSTYHQLKKDWIDYFKDVSGASLIPNTRDKIKAVSINNRIENYYMQSNAYLIAIDIIARDVHYFIVDTTVDEYAMILES